MSEPAKTVEGMSKVLTLKRKIGYEEINDEAEKRLADKRSPQTIEEAKGELAENRYIQPTEPEVANEVELAQKRIQAMQVDKGEL
jgi:hypothetical protein